MIIDFNATDNDLSGGRLDGVDEEQADCFLQALLHDFL